MAPCSHFSGKRVLVLGGGAFGSSAALALVQHPHPPSSITVIDRASQPGPAEDAASYDINRIVRSSYWFSKMYSEMGAASLKKWREPLYSPAYHRSGMIVTQTDAIEGEDSYSPGEEPDSARKGFPLASELYEKGLVPEPPAELPDRAAQQAMMPEGDRSFPGSTADCYGYFEPSAGWANPAQATQLVAAQAQRLGVEYVTGTLVTSIDDSGDSVVVGTSNGRTYEGDLLVVSAGAWTPSLLPELDADAGLVPTGQVVAFIQLSADQAKRYARMPVILDLESDFYIFPPSADHVIKFAIHGHGYTHTNPATSRSEPVTTLHRPDASLTGSAGARGAAIGHIPADGAVALRRCLARLLPELATMPFERTRLCWYTETSDSHFMIDHHPTRPRIVISSGGSGHGFKFLPILGDILVQRLEGTLQAEQAEAFSTQRARVTAVRAAHRRRLEDAVVAGQK